MNILIAPDSFKDALAAPLVCEHLRRGLHRTFPAAHYQLLPLTDGGEGTLLEADAVLANPNVLFATSILTGPLPLAEALRRTPACSKPRGRCWAGCWHTAALAASLTGRAELAEA